MLPESDTPEEILKCLNCTLPKCTNCLEVNYRIKLEDMDGKVKYESGQILRFYKRGMSDDEIAKGLGCHRYTVYRWRLRNGLLANMKSRESGRRRKDVGRKI